MTSMISQVVEGTSVTLNEKFLDEYGQPLLPDEDSAGPILTVYDLDDAIIYQSITSPTTVPGEWQATVAIPYMDLVDEISIQAVWELYDSEGSIRTHRNVLIVQPATDNRSSDVVCKVSPNKTNKITFVVPIRFTAGDQLTVDLAINNVLLIEDLDVFNPANARTQITAKQVVVEMTVPVDPNLMRLEPYSLTVTHTDTRRMMPKMLTMNVWLITPQITVAMGLMENFIDKAKLQNIIPALEYTAGDLVQFLFRGLNMFNQLPPHATDFRGTNMQGQLLEAWVVCSSHAALSAQLLAEGAHAFDFAGQTVNLNVDRTPSIEAALGRLDQQIENYVKPYKTHLTRSGISSGDGSVGSKVVTVGANFGRTTVLQAPTTQLGRGVNGWMRGPTRTRVSR